MFAKSTQFIGMKVNSRGLEIRNNSRIIPTNSGVINFGDATNLWNEIHANSFHGSGANLTGINADLVNDSSPQLGGDLDTNSHHILLDDDHEVKFGNNSDIRMFHANGNANFIQSYNDVDFRIHTFGTTAKLRLQVNESENSVVCTPNGPTELYYDNEMMFRTNQDGSEFFDSDNNCNVYFTCNGTRRGYIFVDSTNGGKMSFYDNQNHPMLSATKNGAVDLYHDNSKKLETTSSGVTVTGAVTATSFSGDGSSLTGISAFVTGMIIIWSGAANAIPSGWVLCNGSNSTPDLRGRFIVGYHDGNGDYDVNDTGGAETVTLSTSQIPSHDHAFSGSGSSSHSHSFTVNNEYDQLFHPKQSMIARGENKSGTESYGTSSATVSLSISGTTNSAGSGGSHENRPPYYALCYIMKT